jgi:hypothetical protein
MTNISDLRSKLNAIKKNMFSLSSEIQNVNDIDMKRSVFLNKSKFLALQTLDAMTTLEKQLGFLQNDMRFNLELKRRSGK